MIRRIIKVGNSDGVVIPVSVIRAHGLKVGDQVEVIINPPGDIAKRLEFLQELEEFQRSRQRPPKQQTSNPLL